MSKRLQVLLPPAEFVRLKRMAKHKGVTVAAWVREALKQASSHQPEGGSAAKLAGLRAAVRHSFPSGDIKNMLADIERGRARGVST